MIKRHTSESGEVAMLMIGIFTAVFSVLVVGLAYIVMNTVRNSNNDNLNHNARSAAEAGVEDAKRLLKYCYVHDFGHTDKDSEAYKLCDILYRSGRQGCNDILSSDAWKKIIGLPTENKDGSLRVKVGGKDYAGDKEAQQYYQCLRVNMMTRSYENKISDLAAGGRSIVLPMQLTNSERIRAKVKRLVVSWHSLKKAPEGDGIPVDPPSGTGLLPKSEWSRYNYPAVVRAQFVPVPHGKITLQKLSDVNRVITLRPTVSGSGSSAGGKIITVNSTSEAQDLTKASGDEINLDDYKMNDMPNIVNRIPLVGVNCHNRSDSAYACSVSFTVNGGIDTDNQDWFIRLNSVYGNTHFRITAYDESDKPLWFDGVQTAIDVTGKSTDSYVRLATRVKPVNPDNEGTRNWWPEYALDIGDDGSGSAAGLCKDIVSKFDTGDIYCDPNGHHSHSDYFKY